MRLKFLYYDVCSVAVTHFYKIIPQRLPSQCLFFVCASYF